LQGVLVFAVACLCANNLGPFLVQTAQATTFIGFKSRIEWDSDITAHALEICIRDICTYLQQTTNTNGIKPIIQKHFDYWDDLRQEGDLTARSVVSYVKILLDNLEII
jgi:hypothetical protein